MNRRKTAAAFARGMTEKPARASLRCLFTNTGKLLQSHINRVIRLISVQSALMPDAHMGFGLPIGSVLATDNAVIPYAVGMDIGCRIALSIIDESDGFVKRFEYQIKQALKNHTHFGMEAVWISGRSMKYWTAQYLIRPHF